MTVNTFSLKSSNNRPSQTRNTEWNLAQPGSKWIWKHLVIVRPNYLTIVRRGREPFTKANILEPSLLFPLCYPRNIAVYLQYSRLHHSRSIIAPRRGTKVDLSLAKRRFICRGRKPGPDFVGGWQSIPWAFVREPINRAVVVAAPSSSNLAKDVLRVVERTLEIT